MCHNVAMSSPLQVPSADCPERSEHPAQGVPTPSERPAKSKSGPIGASEQGPPQQGEAEQTPIPGATAPPVPWLRREVPDEVLPPPGIFLNELLINCQVFIEYVLTKPAYSHATFTPPQSVGHALRENKQNTLHILLSDLFIVSK